LAVVENVPVLLSENKQEADNLLQNSKDYLHGELLQE